ncbi:MAG: DUF1254 domain-containing protein, partial [bacterium]|nr:DUF1254 domain-containing protein [bacterium]
MKLSRAIHKLSAIAALAALAVVLVVPPVLAQEPTPGYNTKIPESVLTPDTVETKLGTLKFFDGIPDEKAAAALFANLDLNRGLQALLNGMPASNFEAGRAGHIALGQEKANQVILFDGLMDSNSLFLTGNAGTVYATSFLDLKRDGPTVVEIPAGTGPGIMVDSFTWSIVDMGAAGPNRGMGGKFLILPPGDDEADVEGIVPQGVYTIARSRSYAVWLLLRGFLKDGKPDYSSQLFRKGIKIYPLSTAVNPPEMEFIKGTGTEFNTVHSVNYKFYEELHAVIDREPIKFL